MRGGCCVASLYVHWSIGACSRSAGQESSQGHAGIAGTKPGPQRRTLRALPPFSPSAHEVAEYTAKVAMVKKLKKLRAACWDLPPEEAPALPAASHELYDETYELHSEY